MRDPARIVWCVVAVLFAIAAAIHVYVGVSMPEWWPWLIVATCVLACGWCWREAVRNDQRSGPVYGMDHLPDPDQPGAARR